MFYKIPIENGKLDAYYPDLLSVVTVSEMTAVAEVSENATVRESWEPITERDYKVAQAEAGVIPKRLSLNGPATAQVNATTTYAVSIYNFEDQLDSDESRTLIVEITSSVSEPATAELSPVNGQATFDLGWQVAGVFKIAIRANFSCVDAEMEVVVSG